MKYPPYHEQDFFVSWHESDFHSKMTLKSISDMLMEMAWFHAGRLGFGFEDLENQDYLWILSRLKIDVNSYPKWRDRITARTWPVDIEKLFANRHFNVKNEDSEVIINAGSKWLIIDHENRRPVRPENVFHERIIWTPEKAVDDIDKLDVSRCKHVTDIYKIRYSDIDFNKHMINSKYIEMVINSIPEKLFNEFQVSSLQINFLAESKMGDELQVYSNQDHTVYKIVRHSDQKEVVHVALQWN